MDLLQGTYKRIEHFIPISQYPDLPLEFLRLYHFIQPYTTPITSLITTVKNETYPILLPQLNKLAILAQDSPAILTVGVFLLLLLIALQILAMMKRMVMWWFSLIFRLLFWGMVGVVVSLVWQRGVENTFSDLYGWGETLGRVWWREYERWDGYQKQSQQQQRFGGSGQSYGRGAGGSWR